MKPSWRIYFLIVASAAVFHFPLWTAGFVLAGYVVFDWLDQWLARRARRKAIWSEIEDDMEGWKPDPKDPEYEEKGEFTRHRLSDQDRMVLGRVVLSVARLLERIR